MDERRQVVGGILPDQEDAAGNFSQTDNAGGPGDRPVTRPARDGMTPTENTGGAANDPMGDAGGDASEQQPDVAGTAGGAYGIGSGSGSSGGSAGGGDNASAGPATDFVRRAGGGGDQVARPGPDEPDGRDVSAAPSSLPPDVTGE